MASSSSSSNKAPASPELMHEIATSIFKMLETQEMIPHADLSASLPYQNDHLVATVNIMLKQKKLSIKAGDDQIPYYCLPKESTISKVASQRVNELQTEERMVYQKIEQSGNLGIWARDIRIKTSLPQTTVTKILKALEKKLLVKSINPINSKTKKVYMLYHVQPSREITGGAWYNSSNFDVEYAKAMQDTCIKCLRDSVSGSSSVPEVYKFIREARISKVELRMEDVRCILNALVYDGRAVKVFGPNGETMFAIAKGKSIFNSFSLPCLQCKMLSECEEGGVISPEKCEYMRQWLHGTSLESW